MCRYIASASARGRELSGRVHADGALRIKARVIVMAGLNARGLQSKLLITPLSSEAIIIIIILQVWCSLKSLHVLWTWLQELSHWGT